MKKRMVREELAGKTIDRTQIGTWHYAVAKKLRLLRDQGVLIVGSGNLVDSVAGRPYRPRASCAVRLTGTSARVDHQPLSSSDDQDRDAHLVPDGIHGLTPQEVPQQAVAVGSHHQHVHVMRLREGDQLFGRMAVRERDLHHHL